MVRMKKGHTEMYMTITGLIKKNYNYSSEKTISIIVHDMFLYN